MTLQEHPRINARYEQDHIRLMPDINIGVAIALDEGLIVPVIHNADKKSISEIAITLEELKKKATGAGSTFKINDFTDGTFTITNLGMFGIDCFNAIINPPESAILAIGRKVKKPIIEGEEIRIKPMMNYTLSIDHRVVDGIDGARFLSDLIRFEYDDIYQ